MSTLPVFLITPETLSSFLAWLYVVMLPSALFISLVYQPCVLSLMFSASCSQPCIVMSALFIILSSHQLRSLPHLNSWPYNVLKYHM